MKKSTIFWTIMLGMGSIVWGIYIMFTKQIHQDSRHMVGPHVIDASQTPLVAYGIGLILILVGLRILYYLKSH